MTLRFGIIGAGNIAAKFCSASRLAKDVEVVAAASRSIARAQRFAAENNVPAAYGDYCEMLEKVDMDAVYVATTGNFHFENIMLCLEHHKHVLCEKAMVMTTAEAEAVFAKARENNCFVMEAMWSCFVPSVQKARQWIAQGLIGPVQIATYTGGINAPAEHRIYDKSLGGGALYDLMVYPIEIVSYIVNHPLKNLQSHLRFGETGVDEMNSLILHFETCDAMLACSTHARIPSPAAFYGPKGYILLHKAHMASYCERYDGQFQLAERFNYPIENGFEFEIAHVRDCILQGRLESEIMPWSSTLQCVNIFERCFENAHCE